jgi:hypothetical protein
LIKQHPIAKGFRQTDPADFPENLAHALNSGFPLWLQRQASQISPHLERLIRSTLETHAFMNTRRAQGILAVAKTYSPDFIDSALADLTVGATFSPKNFKIFLDKLQAEKEDQLFVFPLSDETLSFVRDSSYFDHSTQRN